MLYPLNIDLSGRTIIVVGGGKVAERKVCGILAAGADVSVRVIAPDISARLRALARTGKIAWMKESYSYRMLEGAFLVYAATDKREINASVAAEAKECGILVNIADDPYGSSFQIPSSVRRGDLLLTASTGGGSPALARSIRMELEQLYPAAFGLWLKRVVILRSELQAMLPIGKDRRLYWRMALRPDILAMVRNGELEKAEVELRNAALDIGAQSSDGSG
ncbi:precorrin-2 dehydrogenase/sirohydrochlorin ferrochelatase family protein [Selenomonas noxia]|uniref:precorrin-2 dehydrogenase/sirohydrochlorin ferrochelatase family protein n=1 Tax=Selenomonas noxia TaxID=135083 RepID=UPI0023EFABA4|nr:bifunctional precorrin-2 dehydrogenase/sirohydrochlorin ferrochelatase [Selenomonas noxia]